MSRIQYLNVSLDVKTLKTREFEGHGSIFGNVDLGGDIVLPGAFKRTLAKHRADGTLPAMFWMHQPDRVPGKWLDMEEDDAGLFTRGVLAPTPLGDELHTLMGMKAVRGLSIGYLPTDVDYDKQGNRLLREVDLWETSVVSLAMNPLASVTGVKAQLSARGEYVPTKREMEQRFRDMGCSDTVAVSLAAKLFAASPGDPARQPGEPVPDDEFASIRESFNRLSGQMYAGAL